MRVFSKRLAAVQPESQANRQWLFVAYDQLTDEVGPLSREKPESLGIVLVENPWKAAHRPYHRQKLAAVLANLRHFALEQAERGVAVRHVVVNGPYADALEPLIPELGPMRMMEAAERELRVDVEPLVKSGMLQVLPHEGWLTTRAQFRVSQPKAPYRMDKFYRQVRHDTGLLMENDKPVGGKYSYDTENRKKWPGKPGAPELPAFEPDEVTLEVGELIEKHFSHHPGRMNLRALPATKKDAAKFWRWAKTYCLPHFGPYEDAMSTASRNLFHSRTSLLINLHRLLPDKLVREVEAMEDLPLQSKEGFVRQILGWREFMRHVHLETDGFRNVPRSDVDDAQARDGGFKQWAGHAWPTAKDPGIRKTAAPSALEAHEPLPPAYWGQPSGLQCLDEVVQSVWEEGYSHHITRLMILSNLASLLDVSPRQLTDWFWVAYVDAYDWVVEPNVLGMGTFSVGDLIITKPYVASSNYINSMSDFCKSCDFDPKTNCPFRPMYWAFVERHKQKLEPIFRMKQILRSAEGRSEEQRKEDARVFRDTQKKLREGKRLTPDDA